MRNTYAYTHTHSRVTPSNENESGATGGKGGRKRRGVLHAERPKDGEKNENRKCKGKKE